VGAVSSNLPFVEAIAPNRAWVRGDRPHRRHLSLREIDYSRILTLMQGSGMSEAAFMRQLIQEAIQRRFLDRSEA
jgi:hypothetical protein